MKYLSLTFLIALGHGVAVQTKFKEFCGNVFCVELPATFKVKEIGEGNIDTESYEVTKNGTTFINISSMTLGRYDMDSSVNNIADWYLYILKKHPEITYKIQKDNWFVVSGVDPSTGNIYYWKKIWMGDFICDLYIDYPKNRKKEIEPYLGAISKSFIIHWVEVGNE